MGSLRTLAERPMSNARAALVEGARDRRYTLKELSGALGRNPSYLQQYIVKGSPRELPDRERHALAALLGVDEARLRDADASPPLPVITALASRGRAREASAGTVGDAPLFQEGEPLPEGWGDGAVAAQRFALADLLGALRGPAFAISLERPHGPLQPRHVLVCDLHAATRAGDLVVVECKGRVAAVGILAPAPRRAAGTAAALEVMDGDELLTFPPPPEARPYRVVAVRTCG